MRILVTGPKFFGYSHSIANAFEACGHSVEIVHYPAAVNSKKSRFYRQICSTLSKDWEKYKLKLFRSEIKDYNRSIADRAAEFDVLAVLKGDLISESTINSYNRAGCKTILWTYDKATRYPQVQKTAMMYDNFFSFERSDINHFDKMGVECRFLPMGYDPNKYYSMEKSTEYDIVFVGSIYDNRRDLLEEVIREFNGRVIRLWGRNYSISNPFSIYEYYVKNRSIKKRLINKNIPHSRINEIYNSSKICLNIHHEQSETSYNPRTLEILGSNSFQVVDYKKDIADSFEGGVRMFTTASDLIEIIHKYIDEESERESIASRGHDIVQTRHTYQDRVKTMMSFI